jgi:regulatory protein
MKVIKMKKMPKGRYKLTFDNGSDIILFEEVIINNLILMGKEIDNELYKKITGDNYKANPYHQALQYLGVRMRSREELTNYLLKKNDDEALVDETIKRLEHEGYIDDIAFAKAYLNDKLNLSNDGLNKIRRSLSNYKITDDIIDQAIDTVDKSQFNDKLDKLISKQIRLNTKYTGNMLKNRILNYLINLGYDSNLVLERLDNIDLKDSSNLEREYKKLYKKYSSKYSGYKLDMTIKQKLYQKGYDESEIYELTKKG